MHTSKEKDIRSLSRTGRGIKKPVRMGIFVTTTSLPRRSVPVPWGLETCSHAGAKQHKREFKLLTQNCTDEEKVLGFPVFVFCQSTNTNIHIDILSQGAYEDGLRTTANSSFSFLWCGCHAKGTQHHGCPLVRQGDSS